MREEALVVCERGGRVIPCGIKEGEGNLLQKLKEREGKPLDIKRAGGQFLVIIKGKKRKPV